MKLTKEQQEKFNQASTQIFDYYDMAYGGIALGQFMEAIEKYPELPLKDIYQWINQLAWDIENKKFPMEND